MKVTEQHYNVMKRAIIDMPDNPTMRERWDALWRAIDANRMGYDILRPYNDDHIDTALRRIARGY